MKTKALFFIVFVLTAPLVHAQTYVLEWEGPEGFGCNISDDHFITPDNFDINDDGNPEIVCSYGDTVSTTINIYDPRNSYELIWNHQVSAYAWVIGFGNITSPFTNEIIYEVDLPYQSQYFIMNMTTYQSTQIGTGDGSIEAIFDFDGDGKDEILFEYYDPPQVEIWGDGTIGIDGNRSIQTHKFKLNQNYPNPFNPTTTINYQLEKPGYVELKIYNINGRLVEKLVNENQNSGSYSVAWEAEGISSGMYFYEISIDGKLTETRKAIHLK